MLEHPEAQDPKAGKVLEIGQSAGKENMSVELMYATGLLLGDGCLSAVPNKHCATLHKAVILGSMDEDIVNIFARTLSDVFGCHSKVNFDNNFYEYRTSKIIAFDYFAINTAHKTRFPELKYSTKKEKLAFLSGLLDSDGFASFSENKGREQFRMGFTNTRFIMELTDLLDKLNIKYGKIWVNNHQTDMINFRKVGKQLTRYTVPINAMSFVEAGGYFRCSRKQNKLKRYIEMMKSCYFGPHRLNAERLSTMV